MVKKTFLLITFLALPVLLSSHTTALASEAQPVRRLILTLAVDATHAQKDDWLNKFQNMLAVVSAAYEKDFGITFEMGEVVHWQPASKNVASTDEMLELLATDVNRGKGDIVVGLYGERCIDTFAGKAQPFHGRVLLMTACANKLPTRVSEKTVLSHELAHVFGAFHIRSHIRSVMTGDEYDVFDRQTRQVIGLTRDLNFRKDEQTILDLDANRRKTLTAIYEQGHAPDTANLVAQGLQISSEIFARRQEWDIAVQLAREALEIEPKNWLAYRIFGGWHHGEGRYDEALKAYRRALEFGPNDPVSLEGVAAALAAQGKTRESIAVYDKAAKQGRDWIVPKHNRALAFIDQGRFAEAERDLREVIEKAPDRLEVYINLSAALGLQKKFSEAVDVLKQALKRDPNHHMALANLGYTYALMGKLDEAIVEYRKALALQPNDNKIKANLNNALAQQARARQQ